MNHQSGLVSIIMAAYNAEKYISQAIQSVIDQEYTNWELIIINDGSTDNTDTVIGTFNDDRITYLPLEINKGVSNARNIGLDKANGEFLMFFDADDVLPINSISSRLPIFENNQIAFVDGSVAVFDNTLLNLIKKKKHSFFGNPFDRLVLLDETCFFGPSWMIKREYINTIRFYVGHTHGEDLLFYMNISKNGGIYTSTNEIVLNYRRHSLSAMTNLQGLEKGYLFILKKLEEWSVNNKLINQYRKKIIRIMFKSYLKNGETIKAIKSIFSFY